MPTDKRARHKAYRQAKQAQLRRAQQRRRNLRRGGIVAGVVVVALIIAYLTIGGKTHHHVATGSGKSSTTTTTTATSTTTTTLPASNHAGSVAASPLPAAVAAALYPRNPPARSAACSNPTTGSSSTTTTTTPAKGNAVSIVPAPAKVGFPNLDGSSPRYTKFSSPPPFCINVNDEYLATMKTTAGTMTIELLPRYAPVTVNNFVFLAAYHFFDGVVFQRVIPGFVDQGGDPTGTGAGGPGYTIPDEYPKSIAAYDAGAVAMANTSQPHTGGSQFFVVAGKGGKQLTPTYTMFGQVISGMSVADKINAGGDAADNGDPPKITYKMLSVSITAKPAS